MTDVLVLRSLGLGDLLTAVPALRGLAAVDPGRISLAAPAALAPLVRLIPGVDDLIPTDAGLAGVKARWGVNLHGSGPQSHRLLRSVADEVVGFRCDEAGVAGPAWPPDTHEVDRWCRLVDHAFSVCCDRQRLDLVPPPEADVPQGAVVVHVGAAHEARRWPVSRWTRVVSQLRRSDRPVVLTGSSQERVRARRVAAAAGLPDDATWAGRTDLAELAALVHRAALVISGDTGISHLASAYGTPSVTLFGPVSPRLWGPPARDRHRVLWHGGDHLRPGNPWATEVDERLLLIRSDEVIHHAAELLALPPRGA